MASDKSLAAAMGGRIKEARTIDARKLQAKRATLVYTGRSNDRITQGDVVTVKAVIVLKADGTKVVLDPHDLQPAHADLG